MIINMFVCVCVFFLAGCCGCCKCCKSDDDDSDDEDEKRIKKGPKEVFCCNCIINN
jgi:hypothetical protein